MTRGEVTSYVSPATIPTETRSFRSTPGVPSTITETNAMGTSALTLTSGELKVAMAS